MRMHVHFQIYIILLMKIFRYELMKSCWNFRPEDRPCFEELVKNISQQVEVLKQQKPPPPLLTNPSSAYLKVH